MTSFRAKSSLIVALALALITLIAGSASAQTNARIEGIVTDSTGGALPGTTVTATNVGTNAVRVDVADRSGAYTITALPVGNYRILVELSGFKPETTPVTLTVGQVARMDFRLQVGGVGEVMTVTAAAPLIEKSTSSISTLIDEKQIENLPLNGRNFTQLATLAPGVNRGTPGSNAAGGGGGTDSETFRYAEFGGAGLSVNGVREQFNNYQIEGLDNNESLVNTIAYLPPPEAIREFSVVTTNAPAEFGRAGGAVQNLVIKSGTNQWHGVAYDFYRPRSLAAKPKFAVDKPDFKNNDFGATLGGPIFRDRIFFFGSFHGLRNSIPINAGNYVSVPTAKMRNGDFSELLDPAVSGLSQPILIYNPTTGQPFPGNIIPPSMLNSVGKAYLNVFPLPTRSGVTHNYLTHRQKQSVYDDFDARVDQNITQTDQLFASGSHWYDKFSDPGNIPGYQAGFGAGTSDNKGYALRLGESHVFSGNLVNEFRAGSVDHRIEFLPVGFGTDQNKALGIPGPGGVTVANGISLIGGYGTDIEYLGDYGQYVIKDRTLQVSDAFTWLRSNHSFKFGGTLMRRNMGQQRTQLGKGYYFLRGDHSLANGGTGYEVSDILAGTTANTQTGVPGYVPRTTLSWENALFAQDDWRVNPNLTLNLGLRWDVLTPYYEKNNQLANYDPATKTLVLPNQNGATRSTLKTNWDNFGPRLGFSYLLNDKTALRGGYGIFYSVDRGGIDNQLTENPPAVRRVTWSDGPGAHIHLSDPIPLPPVIDPNNPVLPSGTGIVYIPSDSKNTKVQQWNIDMQTEISSNTSAMLAYVGTRGSNLSAQLSVDSFAGFGGVKAIMYIGSSWYDSLQATLRRRESNGLSYLAAYTYAKATNNTPGLLPGFPSDFGGGALATDPNCSQFGKGCNLNLDKAPADGDVRHRLTVAGTYELPWAKGNAFVGGWTMNTVLTLQTGTPFTVFSSYRQRADQNGNPNNGPQTTDKWFNTSVFTPAKGAQGTAPRNSVRGPGTRALDLSIFKTFALPRFGAVELRVEGFNIFNWAQYSQPHQYTGDSQFGAITGTRLNSERQVQLAARYIY